MLSFDDSVEFTDIVLKSPLPLDQYLVENPRLSLRLLVNGIPCSETPVVDGDRETGRWVTKARLHHSGIFVARRPQKSNTFKLAAIVTVGGLKVQLLAIDHSVADTITRMKERPDGCYKISICEPKCPIQLIVVCKTRLSSSPTGRPFISMSKQRPTIDVSRAYNSYAKSNRANTCAIFSREGLELHLGASHLCDLGIEHYHRFEALSHIADLDRAVTVLQKAVEITPEGQPYKPRLLSNVGAFLMRRFECLGSLNDIENAISAQQEAVRISPYGHPERQSLLTNLGGSLTRRFERLGDLADIDNAISVLQDAVNTTPDGHPDKTSSLNNLGTSLMRRFEGLGNTIDLSSAISFQQDAVIVTPDDHPNKPCLLDNLGTWLLCRFERLGSLKDVDKAISLQQNAVTLTPDGDPSKPNRMSNLGTSFMRRFERLGSLMDIKSATSTLQTAVEITPNGHPDKPDILSNLGASLLCRFERLGNLMDVDIAISVQQKAVNITPDRHPNKPGLLNDLGTSLLCRFEQLGSLEDVDRAILFQQEAVELTSNDHPSKPNRVSNLGTSLMRRFKRLGHHMDINSAITVQQNAVKITPDDHPNKPGLLHNLGNCLRLRFERFESLMDLDNAISVQQDAVKLTPDRHPSKPNRVNDLGTSLMLRFNRLGNPIDIDSAILFQQDSVKITPDGHPNKPSLLINLGVSLFLRFERLEDCDDLENALQSYSRAAYSPVGSPMNRFNAARSWARVANQNSRSPLPAFRCAIDHLPRVAWLGLKETDQHALLAGIGDVVREAVAAAVEHEEYETAVEWGEQGRSVVWKNRLNLRNPINDLVAVNPTLANRLKNVGRQLESPISQAIETEKMPAMSIEDVAQRYSKLATEWDAIIEEIRRIPGFEGFLGAKSFAKLAPAASEGPVVILNIHESRSDALVLISDESSDSKVSVLNIPLEPSVHGLGNILLTNMTGLLVSARVRSRSIHKNEPIQRGMSGRFSSYDVLEKLFEDLMARLSSPKPHSEKRQSEQIPSSEEAKLGFFEILGFLWLRVVKPVLDGLAISAESDHLSRVWWCAAGALSFLPIHAAGIYGTGTHGNIISDYVISSYTPTLTAILDQSQPIVDAGFQIMTVAVAQPSLPGVMPNYGTEDEVQLVQSLAKAHGIQCVNLTRQNATMERVVQEMMESNWIHLACHGQQNIKNSMESGFLLHDRILKLSEIVKLSSPKADFAFLSACQAAKGDEKIAEESVHLTAGMLLLGCRGVIATMWTISDNDAPKVVKDVYGMMLKGGRPNRKGAAYALHEAVKGLRESGADFLSWVPFIHIGR